MQAQTDNNEQARSTMLATTAAEAERLRIEKRDTCVAFGLTIGTVLTRFITTQRWGFGLRTFITAFITSVFALAQEHVYHHIRGVSSVVKVSGIVSFAVIVHDLVKSLGYSKQLATNVGRGEQSGDNHATHTTDDADADESKDIGLAEATRDLTRLAIAAMSAQTNPVLQPALRGGAENGYCFEDTNSLEPMVNDGNVDNHLDGSDLDLSTGVKANTETAPAGISGGRARQRHATRKLASTEAPAGSKTEDPDPPNEAERVPNHNMPDRTAEILLESLDMEDMDGSDATLTEPDVQTAPASSSEGFGQVNEVVQSLTDLVNKGVASGEVDNASTQQKIFDSIQRSVEVAADMVSPSSNNDPAPVSIDAKVGDIPAAEKTLRFGKTEVLGVKNKENETIADWFERARMNNLQTLAECAAANKFLNDANSETSEALDSTTSMATSDSESSRTFTEAFSSQEESTR
jgi:hypothetical protein